MRKSWHRSHLLRPRAPARAAAVAAPAPAPWPPDLPHTHCPPPCRRMELSTAPENVANETRRALNTSDAHYMYDVKIGTAMNAFLRHISTVKWQL